MPCTCGGVGQPEAAHAAVDLGRKSELGRLDDAAVDDVERRRVRVARLESLKIRQRPLGLLPRLGAAHVRVRDILRAAQLDHRVLQERHRRVEPTQDAVVLDEHRPRVQPPRDELLEDERRLPRLDDCTETSGHLRVRDRHLLPVDDAVSRIRLEHDRPHRHRRAPRGARFAPPLAQHAQALRALPRAHLERRAARALGEIVGLEPKVHIRLQKQLPVAAGLGSGSADAAATLRGLAELWNIDTDKVDLKEVGFSLGTDIPACLVSNTLHVSGVGEHLEAGPKLPDVGLVLVNPGVTLATPSVFQARRGGFSPASPLIKVPRNLTNFVTMLEERSNDLTEPALRLAPVIREVLTALKKAPGCRLARLSGSGATCFGIFDDPDAAITAAETIETEGWWVRPTQFRIRNI